MVLTTGLARSRRHAVAAMFVSVLLVIAIDLSTQPSRAAGQAALWHMDDAAAMLDDSGNGNDGTTTDVELGTPGYDGTGGAFAFNGTSSMVVVRDAPSLTPGDSDVTMTVHVRFATVPDDTVGDYDLIRKKRGVVQYKMEIISGGKPYCVFGGDLAKKAMTMRRNLADDAWHTITCSKTADAITMTVDGTTKSRAVTIGSISNTAKVILGGKEGSTGDWYLGLMDEVSISIG